MEWSGAEPGLWEGTHLSAALRLTHDHTPTDEFTSQFPQKFSTSLSTSLSLRKGIKYTSSDPISVKELPRTLSAPTFFYSKRDKSFLVLLVQCVPSFLSMNWSFLFVKGEQIPVLIMKWLTASGL